MGAAPLNRLGSKRLRQSGLSQYRVGGVAAWDSDRHGEIGFGYRTVPDFVTTFALSNQVAASSRQQITQQSVERRSHYAATASRIAVI